VLINEYFKEQVLNLESPYEEIEAENPFFEGEDESLCENLAYVYRLWKIGDLNVLVRNQIHGYFIDENGDNQFINTFALNEFNTELYKSSNNTPSQLLKKEIVNNHLKITKWTVQSYLAGVNFIKFGFISRKKVTDNNNHIITGYYDMKLSDCFKFTHFNEKLAWGMFKQIVEVIRNQNDGYFILMKDLSTNKPLIKLFKTPNIEEDDEDEF